MNTLSAFFASAAKKIEKQTMVVSPRFVEADGMPIPWEFACISAKDNAEIRRDCMRQVPVPGRKNQYTREIDTDLYTARLVAHCTLYPCLDDPQLQDSYGVKTAEELLQTMLTSGEFERYAAKIFEVNGFASTAELVEEAKN